MSNLYIDPCFIHGAITRADLFCRFCVERKDSELKGACEKLEQINKNLREDNNIKNINLKKFESEISALKAELEASRKSHLMFVQDTLISERKLKAKWEDLEKALLVTTKTRDALAKIGCEHMDRADQLEADLAAKEKERPLAIKETADAVADVAVLRAKREVDKYEVDVLKIDLAAARHAASQWLETANERLKELAAANREIAFAWKINGENVNLARKANDLLSETKAKLEEAERRKMGESIAVEDRLKRAEELLSMWHKDYCKRDHPCPTSTFLGDIGQ